MKPLPSRTQTESDHAAITSVTKFRHVNKIELLRGQTSDWMTGDTETELNLRIDRE